MPPSKPTAAEVKAAEELIKQFDGATFVTTYEGLGETWDFNKNPVMLGVYQRHESVEMFKFKSNTEKEWRDVYTFKLSDGTLAAVWGSFSLNRGLSDVTIGSLCRITYNGKEKFGNESDDREVKDFRVEVAQQ